jgi:hypothetical protein
MIDGLVAGLDACYIQRKPKSRGFHPAIFVDTNLFLR